MVPVDHRIFEDSPAEELLETVGGRNPLVPHPFENRRHRLGSNDGVLVLARDRGLETCPCDRIVENMPALDTGVTPGLEESAVMPQLDAMNDHLSGVSRQPLKSSPGVSRLTC